MIKPKKKVVKSVKKVKEPEELNPMVDEGCVCEKIDLLALTFQSEDMNKMVDKLNELIEKHNGSI